MFFIYLKVNTLFIVVLQVKLAAYYSGFRLIVSSENLKQLTRQYKILNWQSCLITLLLLAVNSTIGSACNQYILNSEL